MNRFFFFVISALTVVSAAQANMQFTGVGAGNGVTITFNSNNMSVFAGKLNFFETVTNTSFQTVCGDLGNMIGGGQQWAYSPISAGSVSANMGKAGNIVAAQFNSATTNNECTALQIAVWEAVYDAGTNAGPVPDFGNGVFKASSVSSGILAQAAIYYGSVSTPGTAIYFSPQPSNAGQGQLAPVPEPASMCALAVGALGLMRRSRKKSN